MGTSSSSMRSRSGKVAASAPLAAHGNGSSTSGNYHQRQISGSGSSSPGGNGRSASSHRPGTSSGSGQQQDCSCCCASSCWWQREVLQAAPAAAPAGLALVAADLQLEMGRRSSSSSNVQPAEQYVSPHDMVTLAMSLLAHPQRRASLRNKIRVLREFGPGLKYPKGAMYREEALSVLQGVVSAACPHLQLTDACATGLALVLLPLCVESVLGVKCDFAGEEAVAAFYAALEQPTCVVEELTICGDAFGTRTAAAHLASCLNRNSRIRKVTIHYVPGFSDEAVWMAFSHALTSNNTLHELGLTGSSHGPGSTAQVCAATLADSHKLSALREMTVTGWGTPATMGDMERWGAFLKHNSTIAKLKLGVLSCHKVVDYLCQSLVPFSPIPLFTHLSFALITAWVYHTRLSGHSAMMNWIWSQILVLMKCRAPMGRKRYRTPMERKR